MTGRDAARTLRGVQAPVAGRSAANAAASHQDVDNAPARDDNAASHFPKMPLMPTHSKPLPRLAIKAQWTFAVICVGHRYSCQQGSA